MKKKAVTPTSARKTARSKKTAPAGASKNGHWISDLEFNALRDSLRETQDTLDAIRNGEVDAVVVAGDHGNQIYSLAGAEQPYRVYVEQMQEGAVTVSPEGLILYCNQRFAEMLGDPLEKVIGALIQEHLAEGDWDILSKVFTDGEGVVKHKSHVSQGKGRKLPVSLTANKLPLPEQDVLCLVVMDLTSLKLHDEMRMAKEVAEAANSAKDAFLAALSHELRTPLTPALMSVVEMEDDDSLPEHIRQSVAMIRRNIELEVRLIDDLLDLTRIVRGKLELRTVPMDLHQVLTRALEICQPDVDAKQLHIKADLKAQKTAMDGDPVRLQQALWNVIRNAVKFTPVGGMIVVRTSNKGDHKITLQVKDSGLGFEPDVQKKLFTAFEQGGNHITRQFGGLGLGLSITRNIVEAHGGAITGESAGMGKGAVFTIEIPMGDSVGDKKLTGRSDVQDNSKKKGYLSILLVEDHRDTRETLSRLLTRDGHQVTGAASAGEALGLASGSFDLVISDVGLPDMTGHDMMKELHKKHGLTGIAMSGYGMEEDIARSLDSGFKHHLTKPVQISVLKKLLTEFNSV